MNLLVVRRFDARALLVRSDTPTLDGALRPLVADDVRAAVVERVRASGLSDTEPHLAALVAAGADLGADPVAWMAIEVSVEGSAGLPLWPLAAAPADVVAWLGERAPDTAAAATCCDRIRGLFASGGRDTEDDEPPVSVALAARAYLAWREIERDRARPFMALDAGNVHHALIDRWRDLPKNRRRPFTTTQRDGWAEILHPSKQLGLRLNVQELPERIVHAIKAWRSWQGLRHWAALQCLFTEAGRTGRIRWSLEDHLDALGYADRSRRTPELRATVAAEVEALTRMEVAVYHADGTLRLRGPVLAVTQRGEALRGSEWALQGLELVIHPALYEGVRRADGSIGRLWAPAPTELATIDHARFPYALALGLILPIRWRWDTADGLDHLTLTGKRLLDTAGIPVSAHDPGRAWVALDRNLAELQRVGGLGLARWNPNEARTRAGRCHLYPPQWVRDRLVHGIAPTERPAAPSLLTGGELHAWRQARGWTQAQAAKMLGVGERTIRGAEAASDEPLGRAILAGLDRQVTGRNPADPAGLPAGRTGPAGIRQTLRMDRQESGRRCGTAPHETLEISGEINFPTPS